MSSTAVSYGRVRENHSHKEEGQEEGEEEEEEKERGKSNLNKT